MFDEHEEIEALIKVNAMIPDEDIFTQLADTLQVHIRFEERVLFPFAEKTIPQAEMEEMYKELIVTNPKSKWEDEFWLKKVE
jgi:hemerythrin-like domain-containing protein